MKILTFTTLYPNAVNPQHGIFVENRLRRLLAFGDVEARVVAPVPWFPFRSPRFGAYAALANVPRHERRDGIIVDHPRYLAVPKVGMSAAPFLLYAAALGAVRRVIKDGFHFDLIDAHYFYPDGVAAALLGRSFGKPVFITARGTDVNLISEYMLPRRMILWAAQRATALITVSRALRDKLIGLGADAHRAKVLPNGVDLDMFRPVAAHPARSRVSAGGPVLISVGNLVSNKGHDLVIRALPAVPKAGLIIVGDGPERRPLDRLVTELDLSARVEFLGRVSQSEMPALYSAADALVLATSREGMPNVVLEALACGTPVVATNVGGVPEILAAPEAGILVDDRSPTGFGDAIDRLLANRPDRMATRAYAMQFGWDATVKLQHELFSTASTGTEPWRSVANSAECWRSRGRDGA